MRTLLLVSSMLWTGAGCVWITDAEYADRLATGGAGDDTGCQPLTWYLDADGDGYGDPAGAVEACERPDGAVTNDADCDDTDPNRNPTTVWYLDGDGDGFGDADSTSASCEKPSGYVQNNIDCNDVQATIYPGAPEDCTTDADDNCDGDTNNIDALGCTEWAVDVDEDGFGDPDGVQICACEPPAGTVGNSDDCDDSDPAVSPAAAEVCGDLIDNNCDGSGTECQTRGTAVLGSLGLARLEGDVRFDYVGLSVGAAAGFLGDDGAVLVVGASRSDRGGATDGGAVFFHAGPLTTSLNVDDLVRVDGDTADGRLGSAVAGAGDVDGDGFGDVLVGAPRVSSNAGRAYLLLGPLTASADVDSVAATTFTGTTGSQLGAILAGVGDIDRDGQDDFLLGVPAADDDAGVVWLLHSPPAGVMAPDGVGNQLAGEEAGDQAGVAAAGAGDVDGDGVPDLVIGANRSARGGTDAGAVYVVLGPVTGDVSLSDADAIWTGQPDEQIGEVLAGAGDTDGDGYNEILAAAPGAARVYLAGWDTHAGVQDLPSIASARLEGASSGGLGTALVGAGDIDGDGRADVAAGEPQVLTGGATWVMYGPLAGVATTGDWLLIGDAEGELVGYGLAAPGDVDADGYDDLFIAEPGASELNKSAGAAWLVPGAGL